MKPNETITRLQRGILRLALSFHGQNPDLDRRLKKLGSSLRSGCKDTKFQSQIDEIVEIIVTQSITQNADQRGGRALSDLLQRIQSRVPDDGELGALVERLSLPIDRSLLEDTLDEAADAIARLAADGTQVTSAGDTGVPKSALFHFLDRIDVPLSVRSRITQVKTELRERRTYADLVDNLDEVASMISEALGYPATGATTDDAREQLLLLMNLIPFPADLVERSAMTRKNIEDARDADTLYRCIPEIADLTAAMRAHLQAEIDELAIFLKSTLTRLREFESLIFESREYTEQTLRNTLDFETRLGTEAQSIRDEISDETDIDAIKHAVNLHLDVIDEKLGEFVQTEDVRSQQACEKINEMVSALNELEFEAKELRENLQRQHEQVLIDPLTGILNRSGYDESVNKEYVRWRRYRTNLSLAVIDLDMFKSINDSYGHSAGDKVLATVARQIESQIRECDILCRYGGEEFVLVLPETTVAEGLVVLDKLRRYIAGCNFHYQRTPVPVTLSCGIAGFARDDSIEDVFNRADQAMYLAKRSGRNQCRTEGELQQESA